MMMLWHATPRKLFQTSSILVGLVTPGRCPGVGISERLRRFFSVKVSNYQMKVLFAKSGRRLLLSAVSFLLLNVGGFRSEVWSQDIPPPDAFLAPPRVNLLPLHWPDLT